MRTKSEPTGQAEAIGAMGAVSVEFEIRGEMGLDTLLEAGERDSCGGGVKTVGSSGEMAVGGVGPTVAVVTSFQEGFPG